MNVWVAFQRGEFFGEAEPPGPPSFAGAYATRDEALEHCWPPGDDRWIQEVTVGSGVTDDDGRVRDARGDETVTWITTMLRLHDKDRLLNAHSVADWIENESAARSPQGEDHEAEERGAVALCRFVFPGYFVDRLAMARAVLDAAKGDEGWMDRLPEKRIAAGSPQGEDHEAEVGRIVRFLVDAGCEAAAAMVEIEFGRPPVG